MIWSHGFRLQAEGRVRRTVRRVPDGEDLLEALRPRPGRLYKFTHPMTTTRGGVRHKAGDLLLAVAPTDLCPHGEVGPFGHNWDCISLHDRSVWSTLEHAVQVQTVHHVRDLTPEEVGAWEVMEA